MVIVRFFSKFKYIASLLSPVLSVQVPHYTRVSPFLQQKNAPTGKGIWIDRNGDFYYNAYENVERGKEKWTTK